MHPFIFSHTTVPGTQLTQQHPKHTRHRHPPPPRAFAERLCSMKKMMDGAAAEVKPEMVPSNTLEMFKLQIVLSKCVLFGAVFRPCISFGTHTYAVFTRAIYSFPSFRSSSLRVCFLLERNSSPASPFGVSYPIRARTSHPFSCCRSPTTVAAGLGARRRLFSHFLHTQHARTPTHGGSKDMLSGRARPAPVARDSPVRPKTHTSSLCSQNHAHTHAHTRWQQGHAVG